MANNFFNDSNKAYSENLNDGILVGNAFAWTLDVSLPTDTDGVFPNSSDVVMAKVADVSITPNSNLSIGSTITNRTTSAQVYRLTVYPNFNRFGGFKSIKLTATGQVSFYIANKGGTSPIASNLNYDDLSNVPELKVLKEYDIVVTIPRNAVVSGLSFVFQSSSADVSGSIAQSNVTGLASSLSVIDGRLSILENADDGVFFYELYASDYNPTIDTNITVSCRCTDIHGDAVEGKSLTLYRNGTSVSSSITNNEGIASWSVTCNDWGLVTFSANTSSTQIFVRGWKKVWSAESNKIVAYTDGNHGRLILDGLVRNVVSTTFGQYGSSNPLSDIAPIKSTFYFVNSANIIIQIGADGTIWLKSNTGATQSNVTVHGQVEWGV